MTIHPLHGLVLAGGFSRRMGRDKALLEIHGIPQVLWTAQLLAQVCESVSISCRKDQPFDFLRGEGITCLYDEVEGKGPMTGILRAADTAPEAAWFVVACDLPMLSPAVLQNLRDLRRPDLLATAYLSAHDGLPEPLCAIYEPSLMPLLRLALEQGLQCPRKVMIRQRDDMQLLLLPELHALDNFNQPRDLETTK